MGAVDGLCGTFDGNPRNDRRLPDGRLVPTLDEFAQGWAKPGMPPNACAPLTQVSNKKEVWDLCDVITLVSVYFFLCTVLCTHSSLDIGTFTKCIYPQQRTIHAMREST